MEDMMNRIAMLLAGQQPAGNAPAGNATMTASMTPPIYPGRPGDYPVIVNPPGDIISGGRRKSKPLSPYEKRVNAATVKGPSAFTPAMRKNLGMDTPTVGYGDPVEDNTSAFTRLVNLFAPPRPAEPTSQAQQQPAPRDVGGRHPPPMIPPGRHPHTDPMRPPHRRNA